MADLDLDAIENRLDFGHHDAWALLTEARRLRELVGLREHEIATLNEAQPEPEWLDFVIDMAYMGGLGAAGQYVKPSTGELRTVRDGVRQILRLVKNGTIGPDAAVVAMQEAMRTCAKREQASPVQITLTESELEELVLKAPDLRDLVYDDDPAVRKTAVKKHLRGYFKVVPDPT